jgi:hypothetical protein
MGNCLTLLQSSCVPEMPPSAKRNRSYVSVITLHIVNIYISESKGIKKLTIIDAQNVSHLLLINSALKKMLPTICAVVMAHHTII